MKFILATKQAMLQMFTENGDAVPGTLLKAGPVLVTQVKTKEKDGYRAVQVGYGTKKKLGKALAGHVSAGGKGVLSRHVREFPLTGDEELSVGQAIDVSVFSPGDTVSVSGVSKGKGFQGVVKRHGFKGGRGSHGNKHSFREGGSIGGGGRAGGRVVKGMRMPGRMGAERVTVKNLRVLAIDTGKSEMIVSGALPGHRGTVLEIRG
ncbi:MAG: 50S ribosomal protein L3 [Candidatus Lloydbacteria bacterium RIFCSPHIGHO2_02_FULL_51_22]|uniref:Large ribosomal subunit protein uL3 n=3 Tax=Candidatus Lloydiibacteriota TaxID=1817910 RepID=A0A1G2DBS0_9BACT|nr:MAG: 50S ribosomal protein L3 [Candidatus Lloydbacteria bacterium RIFCSPHIGHO2_02_FULL_51_22]OGZ15820.1 MAG: 50S ribosomal protein L3 [Candidatus Lloydbacteria bacterium RIFCSPLOWO2_02_FULL_51_11]OGZ16133.1 MAG: 50S ribosomal protein L3 [Candidatus Lloydbacteria bacterium RIFCSPLOWO2_12_FULL_51_9]